MAIGVHKINGQFVNNFASQDVNCLDGEHNISASTAFERISWC